MSLADVRARLAEREALRWEGVSKLLQAPLEVGAPFLVWDSGLPGFCWKLERILQRLLGAFMGLGLACTEGLLWSDGVRLGDAGALSAC